MTLTEKRRLETERLKMEGMAAPSATTDKKSDESYTVWAKCSNCGTRRYFLIPKGKRWFETIHGTKCPTCEVSVEWDEGRLSQNESYEDQEKRDGN